MTKRQLTTAQQWLIEQGQRLNFGRISFTVRNGEPARDQPCKTRRAIKLASVEQDGRPEARLDDFELRREQAAMIVQLRGAPDGATVTIEFKHGLPAGDLDPAALRSDRPKRKPKSDDAPPEDQVKEFVERFITPEPRTRSDILLAASQGGYSGRSAQQLLRWAVDLGLAYWWGGGRFRPSAYATVPRQTAPSLDE